MKDIKRVLACVDLSEYSKMTINYAIEVVRGLQAEILLLNVINQKDIDAVEGVTSHFPEGFSMETYLKRIKAERQTIIQELLKNNFPAEKAQIKILIRVGIPFDTILQTIETEQADLVVIASKGKSNLIGTLQGSNAEKVFRRSPVPVLSARSREKFGQNR